MKPKVKHVNLFHQLYPPQHRQGTHLQKGGKVGIVRKVGNVRKVGKVGNVRKLGKGGNVGKLGKGGNVTGPPLTTLIDTKTIKIHIINFIFDLMF